MDRQDRKHLEILDGKVDNLTGSVDRILTYIETDPNTGRKGLFEQVAENTEDIQHIKTDKKVLLGKVGVAATILGLLGSVIGYFLKIFFEPK